MVDVTITGQDTINQKLERLSGSQWIGQILQDVAQKAFDYAEEGANRHSKTGALIRALGAGPTKTGDLEYRVGFDLQVARHALFVHWGTAPHRIYPKDRKALRWASGGKFFFAKFVNHPGYKGDPMLVTASQNVLRDFDSIVQRTLNEVLK